MPLLLVASSCLAILVTKGTFSLYQAVLAGCPVWTAQPTAWRYPARTPRQDAPRIVDSTRVSDNEQTWSSKLHHVTVSPCFCGPGFWKCPVPLWCPKCLVRVRSSDRSSDDSRGAGRSHGLDRGLARLRPRGDAARRGATRRDAARRGEGSGVMDGRWRRTDGCGVFHGISTGRSVWTEGGELTPHCLERKVLARDHAMPFISFHF